MAYPVVGAEDSASCTYVFLPNLAHIHRVGSSAAGPGPRSIYDLLRLFLVSSGLAVLARRLQRFHCSNVYYKSKTALASNTIHRKSSAGLRHDMIRCPLCSNRGKFDAVRNKPTAQDTVNFRVGHQQVTGPDCVIFFSLRIYYGRYFFSFRYGLFPTAGLVYFLALSCI